MEKFIGTGLNFFTNCNMTVVPDDYSISYVTHDKAVKELKEGITVQEFSNFSHDTQIPLYFG